MHEVLLQFHPGIERGYKKTARLNAGADYAETLHRSVRQLHQDLPTEIAEKEAELAGLDAKQAKLEASMEKTREYIRRLNRDQHERSEKEEKRLKTYEARLQKKAAEQAELAGRQEDERRALEGLVATLATRAQRVVAREVVADRRKAEQGQREEAVTQRETAVADRVEAVRIERKFLAAAGAELIAREQAVETDKAKVTRVKDAYEAGLAGLESVVDEIATGTMRVNPDTGKVAMASQKALRAMPQSLRNRLLEPALRLVRMLHEAEGRSQRLGRLIERVKEWLGRDDLTHEARREGERIRRDLGM